MSLKLEGAKDLEAALRELPRVATRRSLVRRVLRKAGGIFADLANAKAPRDKLELAGSYHVGNKLTRRQRRLAKAEQFADIVVHVGTAHPQGQMQEFGTENHGPQPHARPSWNQTKQQIFDAIAKAMREEVARAVQRARRKAARAAKR